jgi:hypothetical protein
LSFLSSYIEPKCAKGFLNRNLEYSHQIRIRKNILVFFHFCLIMLKRRVLCILVNLFRRCFISNILLFRNESLTNPHQLEFFRNYLSCLYQSSFLVKTLIFPIY